MVEEETSVDRLIPPRRWPGFRIAAAVRMAFDARKLIIAAAGLLLLQLGWSLLDLAFLGSIGVTPNVLPLGRVVDPADTLSWSAATVDRLTYRLFEPARILTTPLFALLNPTSGWLTMLHAMLGVAWLFAIWGLCGGAIARIAVLQEAQARQPGIAEAGALRLAIRPALVLTPCCPMLALAFCSLAGLVFGLIYRLPAGGAIAGTWLFIPLAAGLVMTLLVAALVAGWPFFHAALAAGADDALDALSRTYSYLSQRLVLFAVGVALAWAVGMAGLALVDLLSMGVIRLTQWSLSLSGSCALDRLAILVEQPRSTHGRRGHSSILAGGCPAAGPRLGLQLFLDSRGIDVSLVEARRRWHAHDHHRPARCHARRPPTRRNPRGRHTGVRLRRRRHTGVRLRRPRAVLCDPFGVELSLRRRRSTSKPRVAKRTLGAQPHPWGLSPGPSSARRRNPPRRRCRRGGGRNRAGGCRGRAHRGPAAR